MTTSMSLLAVVTSRAMTMRPLHASVASGEAAAAAADQPMERRPVTIILPNRKPQKWSTGMEPGSYGGGPTTIEPCNYWMGKEDRDPIGNTDDFISNKNFLPHMERVIANGGTDPPATIPRVMPADEDSGFLSINRAMDLDSVDVVLSKELVAPAKSILKTQLAAARRGRSTGTEIHRHPMKASSESMGAGAMGPRDQGNHRWHCKLLQFWNGGRTPGTCRRRGRTGMRRRSRWPAPYRRPLLLTSRTQGRRCAVSNLFRPSFTGLFQGHQHHNLFIVIQVHYLLYMLVARTMTTKRAACVGKTNRNWHHRC